MKIGIDIHGVINLFPDFFCDLAKESLAKGYEVHLITGKAWAEAEPYLESLKIPYSHHFSIVDYHQSIGTEMINKSSGWWMERNAWDRSKGEYCQREGIQMHFDNDLHYAPFFPETCTFIWVRPKGFENFINTFKLIS